MMDFAPLTSDDFQNGDDTLAPCRPDPGPPGATWHNTGMVLIGRCRASWGVGGPSSSSAPVSRSNPLQPFKGMTGPAA